MYRAIFKPFTFSAPIAVFSVRMSASAVHLTSHLPPLTPPTDWDGSSGRWNKKQPVPRIMLSLYKVKLIRDFLAFFKPTHADSWVLLTAYGIHTIDAEQIESYRSTEQTETDRASDTLTHRRPIAEPPLPIPIGIRSDITWIRRTASTPKGRYNDYPETLARLAAQSPVQILEPSQPDRHGDDHSNGSDQSNLNSSTPANLSTAFDEMVERCRFDLPESSSEERDHIGIPDIIGAVIIVTAVLLLIQRLIFA